MEMQIIFATNFAEDMHTILLCIGSNKNAEKNIEKAKKWLELYFSDIIFSETCYSKPYGKIYSDKFMNMLAAFRSDIGESKINGILKRIETSMGRNPQDKLQGEVVIDIDMVRIDDTVIRTKDFEREYVQTLLPSFSLALSQI